MKLELKKFSLTIAGVSALGLLAATPALSADSLTVVSWGGAYTKSQVEAYHKPYTEKTGTKILSENYNGGLAEIKAQVDAGSVNWDLVDLELADVVRGCDEGLLEPLNLEALPASPDGKSASDDFIAGTLHECGVATIIWSTIYAYDDTKFSGAKPTGIADFFDTGKFPGKRGMRKSPKVNLEFALMADGVPSNKVYEVLATPEGVDRAFAKLDSIKDQVVWWEDGEEPAELLARNAVTMTSVYGSRIFRDIAVDQKPYALIWDHQLWDVDFWAIPKGSRNKERAIDFISFATSTAPLAEQTRWIPYGPVRRSANALVGDYALAADVDVGPYLPTYPDNMATALRNNSTFWRENGEVLVDRFNAWLVD